MQEISKPLHILFVLDHFSPYTGGAETLSYELTTGLAKKGHRVTVITSRYDQKLEAQEMIKGVDVVRIGSNRINFQRTAYFKALAISKQEKVDIIHASTFFSIIPGWFLRLTTRIKTVLTVHEIYGKLWFQFLGIAGLVNYLYECFCMSFLKFDRYICVSNYTKNCLRISFGVPDTKLRTVYNGIDYDFRDPEKIDQEKLRKVKEEYNLNESYVGLYFGRMGVAKGMNDVLASLPIIIKSIPNYKQVFITPKKQAKKILGLKNSFSLDEIQKYIDTNNLADHIVWIESVKRTELRDWIGMADLTILPSRAEGFGFAVSEVCALEKNLVTTNVASIPEVVYGKVAFVEPGNAEDIAQKVIDFHGGKHEIIAKKEFLWSECVDKMEEVYGQLSTRS